MEKKKQEVEKDIIESAKKLFINNGFRATTMRNIATDAGVNLAMLNYYFRSKENLFDIIFDEAFQYVSGNIIPVLIADMGIIQKIRAFVDAYIEGLIENSDIPGFVFQELFINPKRFMSRIETKPQISEGIIKFKIQLKEEVDKGNIKHVGNPNDLLINVISMCAFPFIAKPIIEDVTKCSDAEYKQGMLARKKSVADFIINAITP